MVVPRFVSAALRNEPLTVYGPGTQSRCFCHVYDAIRGIIAIIDSEATIGDAFNVGNNHEISIEGLAQRIIEVTQSQSTITKIPYDIAYNPGFEDMQRRIPDIAKINEVLGWRPLLSLEEIITDVAHHLR